MRIPIPDLIGHPGASRRYASVIDRGDIDAPLGAWGPSDDALTSPLDVELILEMLLDGLFARGTVRFTTTLPCARCLADVATEQAVAVAELYVDPANLADDEEVEVGYELQPEGLIDIEALLRDAVGTTLPLRQLCQESCLGLCPRCGADRNVEDCGHGTEREPDPRWAKLADLQLPPG